MSDDKTKKKRFEGLIQFREALRQAIVCLQASMGERFAHPLQSSYLHRLDDEAQDKAHHLLFATHGQDIGQVDAQSAIKAHHILARIYQQSTSDLKDELRWTPSLSAQISAWLDPADPQATAYLVRLISMLCNSHPRLDLREAEPWGSVRHSKPMKKPAEALPFVKACQLQFGFCAERREAIEEFVTRLLPLLKSLKAMHLLSDGTSFGLVIEGQARAALPHSLQAFFDQLAPCRAHTLSINCTGRDTQFAMFTPIRMNHASLGAPSLKGMIVIHEPKALRKPKNAGLAS